MATRRMHIEAPCPSCKGPGLEYTVADLDLPHFGKVNQLHFECTLCGFRHSDFLIGTIREPTRYVYDVRTVEDVMVRVVRSTSGTIRVPELGILIEPGPASDAYVSNIEGVLDRVERVLRQLINDADTAEGRQAAEERLADLLKARDGRFPFTFILEDPYGNSVIVHEKARMERLSAAEAASLQTGQIALEMHGEPGGGLPEPSGNGHGNGGAPPP